MPDNRVDITIQAQNRSRAAFQQAQQDIQRTSQAVQGTARVFQDATGRFHDAATGRWVSAQRVIAEGMTVIQRDAKGAGDSVGELNEQFRRGGEPARRYGAAVGDVHGQLIALSVANRLVQRSIQATIVAQSREAITLERLNVGLQSLSSSYAEAAAQRERLIEASRLPGLNLEQALRSSLQLQAIGETGERATRIITEFGNALALSGQPASELRAVISGLRQISGEGKVLQEDIGIITSRVAALGRGLRETFGGTRAEDIRRFYDALGVRGSEQGPRFISDVLKILSELPRAGDTAANAIENLQDTFDRAQATIGQNFLPVIREVTAGLEGLAKEVEDNPDLARSIAQWETFGGVLGSVTFGVAGLGAALKILGPGALAALKSPLGIAALGAGAVAAGFLAMQVGAEEATPLQKNLARTSTELAKSFDTLADAQQAVADAQTNLNRAREAGVGVAAATSELAKAQNELRDAGEARIGALESRASALNESLEAETEGVKTLTQEYKDLATQIEEAAEQSRFIRNFLEQGEIRGLIQGLPQSVNPRVIAQVAEALANQQFNTINEELRTLENAQREQRGVVGTRDPVTGTRSVLQNVGGRSELPRVVPGDLDDDAADAFERSIEDTTQTLERFNKAIAEGAIAATLPQHIQRDFLGQPDATARQPIPITTRPLTQTGALPQPDDISNLEVVRAQAERIYKQIGQARSLAELDTIEEILAANQDAYTELQGNAETYYALLARLDEQRVGLTEESGIRIAEAQRRQNERIAREFEQSRQRGGQRDQQDRDRARQAARQLGVEGANRRIAQAQRDFLRLQNQQEDAFSSQRLQRIQHETAQALARYQEFYKSLSSARYQAFVEIGALSAEEHRTQLQSTGRAIQNLEQLYGDLGVSIDEALRAERLERFRDGLRDIVDDLGRTAFDYLFDSLTDSTDRAADALENYSYRVGEATQSVQLLVSDVTRLERLQEDAALREDRLGEDRDRRIRQLRRQQAALAARAPVGDQQALQRNIQQRQDIAFRIRELREDFGVRISRAQEDFIRRRDRQIEDATARRDNRRDVDDGLLDRLGSVLASHLSSALSSAIAGALAGALTGALTNPFNSLIEAIKGLFSGGDDSDAGTGAGTGTTDLTGALDIPAENITLPQDALDLKGKIALASGDITPPAESVALTGAIALTTANITPPAEPVALSGVITATLVKAFTEPIPLTGIINATLNAPQSIDLSGVPVTLPDAAVDVTTPESVDLSAVPVTGIPAQSVDVAVPSAIDLSSVPVTLPTGQALAVGTPDQFDLSGVPVTLPDAAVEVSTPESIDLSDVAVTLPAQRTLDVNVPTAFDLSDASFVLPPGQALDVNVPTGFDLSGVPVTLPTGLALEIATPNHFDLSDVPVSLPPAALEVATPDHFDLSGVPVTLPDARLDVQLNLPDPELLPPIDLGGLRLTNTPTVQIPYTLTPGDDTSTTDETPPPRAVQPSETAATTGQTTADVVRNEGRRDKVFGGQGAATPTDVTTAQVVQGLVNRAESEGFFNPLKEAAELIQSAANAILSSGVSVGSEGVSAGAGGSGLDTGQIARDLAADLDGSFRSDVVPTLLGNQPGTVQPGAADPDEDTAQAPAAIRATADAINTIANVLSVDALASVAQAATTQETTLSSIASTLDSIRIATQRTADAPLVDRLLEAGVLFPQSPEDRINSALPDFLTQQGLGLFADQDRLNSFLADMGPTPDLTGGLGDSEGNPLFAKVEFPDVQKVEVIGGKVDANVTNEVSVKQVGTVKVTQEGEWVIQLASGATIPVYNQGGHVTVDIAGGLEGLAIQLADEEVGLRAVGAI